MRTAVFTLVILFLVPLGPVPASADDDPYLWLEDIEGEKALSWVNEHNDSSLAVLKAVPEYKQIFEANLMILDSDERIPSVGIRDKWLYNFWRDADHVRGIWRRTTVASYRTDEPDWELVIDLDALAEAEDENWVWKGASCLEPDYRLCMIALSRGGGDATVRREFDTAKKRFVENGFKLAEAKSRVSWKDENTLWVGTDLGEGTLTTSGYPRIAMEWKRGTTIERARTIFEGEDEDVASVAYSIHTPEGRYDFVERTPEFFRGIYYLILDGRLVKLDLPDDVAMQEIYKDHMLLSLRSDWTVGGTTYPQDALIAIDLDDFLEGSRKFDVLFEPSERTSLGGAARTRDHLLIQTLDNIRGRILKLTLKNGEWSREEVDLPGLGSVDLAALSSYTNDWFFTYTDFLIPSSLYLVEEGKAPVSVKSTPAWFDSTGMRVEQYETSSKDGTRIPYFAVLPKGFRADGTNPTILNGYGGFEVPKLPRYSGMVGTGWLERGGVYVVANIRGGGEFGPRWHQAALKENRQKAFDDFIAVAEDLIRRKITSPKHLGIEGGSNGGLLVGAAFTQRPELFNAVLCAVPLLDMRRYHELLAGASWMAEYGDPDKPEEWAYIKNWSPYHNLKEGVDYPKVFFFTSTRDDRVHPGHARKMVARMEELGAPVYYFENTEGGHAGASNNEQRAKMWALAYAYAWSMLR